MYWEHCVQHRKPAGATYADLLEDEDWEVAGAFAEWLVLALTTDDIVLPDDFAHSRATAERHLATVHAQLDDTARAVALDEHYQGFLHQYASAMDVPRTCGGPVRSMAFVSGHGCHRRGQETVVPQGMTLHFLADSDTTLFALLTFDALGQGVMARARQSYAPGDVVPNYVLSPEHCALDEAALHQANAWEADLVLVGGPDLPAEGGEVALCSADDPTRCVSEGAHTCDGVLATLAGTGELFFLTCRAEEGDDDPSDTWRMPGEVLPLTFAGGMADRHLTRLRSDYGMARVLENATELQRARISTDRGIRDRLAQHSAHGLLRAEGELAYLAMYLGADAWEKEAYDDDPDLVRALHGAEELVQRFAAASAKGRARMLAELTKGLTETQARARTDFLGGRVPGFRAWRELGPRWDAVERHNIELIRACTGEQSGPATFSCLYVKEAVLLNKGRGVQGLAETFEEYAGEDYSTRNYVTVSWERSADDESKEFLVEGFTRPNAAEAIAILVCDYIRIVNGVHTSITVRLPQAGATDRGRG
ncbi:putative adhesin [Streptomyces sp. NPDC059918]|uniref:putative adhesin n=1 Tax=unclassified Streptomyces TaxID=2593676 RepID=UPI00364C9D82